MVVHKNPRLGPSFVKIHGVFLSPHMIAGVGSSSKRNNHQATTPSEQKSIRLKASIQLVDWSNAPPDDELLFVPRRAMHPSLCTYLLVTNVSQQLLRLRRFVSWPKNQLWTCGLYGKDFLVTGPLKNRPKLGPTRYMFVLPSDFQGFLLMIQKSGKLTS